MSIKNIIQESLNKNPIGLKEALTEELRSRVAAVLESMIAEKKSEDDDEEDDDGKPYDADSKGEYDDDEDEKSPKKSKKELDEEVEQIDEISSDLAKRYTKRAKMDRDFNDEDLERLPRMVRHGTDDQAKQASADMMKLGRRNSKRTKGINRAAKRITNEEVEQIDEISTPKLARYMKKASTDLANKSSDREFMKSNLPNFTDKDERTKEKVDDAYKKSINKRKTGIATAASKISNRHRED